jgi:hypothetical protein
VERGKRPTAADMDSSVRHRRDEAKDGRKVSPSLVTSAEETGDDQEDKDEVAGGESPSNSRDELLLIEALAPDPPYQPTLPRPLQPNCSTPK